MKTIFSGNTQRKLGAVLAGGALLFMSSFAMAAITGSRHDLSSTGAFNQFTPTAGSLRFAYSVIPARSRYSGTRTAVEQNSCNKFLHNLCSLGTSIWTALLRQWGRYRLPPLPP